MIKTRTKSYRGCLLPIAFQGTAMYAPLARVIIGGLISSTLLARIVTPVMYQLIAPSIEAPEAERHEALRSLAAEPA